MRTGRFRFFRNWLGQQVLYVEVSYPADQYCSYRERSWIKATASDAWNIEQALDGLSSPKVKLRVGYPDVTFPGVYKRQRQRD